MFFDETVTSLAVVGSRTFSDGPFLRQKMDEIMEKYKNIDTFVSGGAIGADTMGEKYATKTLKLKPIVLKPNWKVFGKKAGILRNQDIVDRAHVVLAFWDGESKGTSDSIRRAKKAGKRVYVYKFPLEGGVNKRRGRQINTKF